MKTLITILLFIFLPYLSNAQKNNPACTKKKELSKNFLSLQGFGRGHPYSLFDKNEPNYNLDTCIKQIRTRIFIEANNPPDDENIELAYARVYSHANQSEPGDHGLPKSDISDLARWAKSTAFVTLVCLNGNAYTLSLAERDFVK